MPLRHRRSAGVVGEAANLQSYRSMATMPSTTPMSMPAFSSVPPCSMCNSSVAGERTGGAAGFRRSAPARRRSYGWPRTFLHAVPHGIQFALIEMSRHRATARQAVVESEAFLVLPHHHFERAARAYAAPRSASLPLDRAERTQVAIEVAAVGDGIDVRAGRAPGAGNSPSLPAVRRCCRQRRCAAFSPAPSINFIT